MAGLITDRAGNLYGTTEFGGYGVAAGFGSGTVFKVTQAGTETVLYALPAVPMGLSPSPV